MLPMPAPKMVLAVTNSLILALLLRMAQNRLHVRHLECRDETLPARIMIGRAGREQAVFVSAGTMMAWVIWPL